MMVEHLSELDVACYMDGTLSHEKRSAVESHLADCDECRREVSSVSTLVKRRRRLPGYAVPLTAAAAIVLVMIGVNKRMEPPVFRGVERIGIGTSEFIAADPTLIWTPVKNVAQYRVTITDSAGNIVSEKVTTDTTTTIPLPKARDFQWYVTAILNDGRVESSPVRSFRTP